jgi:hypothetical protein
LKASGSPSVPSRSWPRRIGWLILLWAVSVIAVAALAGVLRLLMSLAGLTR